MIKGSKLVFEGSFFVCFFKWGPVNFLFLEQNAQWAYNKHE